MASSSIPRHVVLTGPPGIGKTTLIQKACDVLRKNNLLVQGFYTEELRERGRRIGFDVVTLDGKRGPLARIGDDDPGHGRQYRVGQYLVKLQQFEQTALPCLRKQAGNQPIYVIDEVGKMELFSQSFIRDVKDLLNKPNNTLLTTIPIPKGRPIPLVEEIRNRSDALLFEISKDNRDNLLDDIVKAITASFITYSGG